MARKVIEEIAELKRPNVHIKNPEELEVKLNGLINGGVDKLQVVSDFDQTITKQHENGKRHMSSFRIFEHCPSVTTEFKEETNKLYEYYYPKEYDPTISLEEKSKIMEEWWRKSEKALSGLKVSQIEINEVVAKLSTSLRDGTKVLFQNLSDSNVPVLVFSAGLGDTVQSVLMHYDVYFPNIKVISNFLSYNNDGVIEGFKGPLIHVLNKNEVAIQKTDYYDLIKERSNVILIGDSLGDAKMADGIAHADNVLKIGFIFEQIEGNLPAYLNTFDIVLEDDQTMDVVAAIVKMIK